ncbi:MAG: hypothetical protein IJY79_08845 [Clostridia bacterium]|nr:hypothetical protein [Clostridia bacterium]
MAAKDIGNALLLYLQGDKSKWFDIENCEILIIKDTDYLIGKTTTQEEFLKLIQTKRKNGTHTILELNCSLKELPILSKCLLENSKFILL